MLKKFTFHLFTFLFYLLPSVSFPQACDPSVPVYNVDLTGNADSAWVQPNVIRNGSCCGYSSPPNNCVKFILTLDANAEGIIFNITGGALPTNLQWQLMDASGTTCDPTLYNANVPVCLNGTGPHNILFCKPGGNDNTYHITSIPEPNAGNDIVVSNGCIDSLMAFGFDDTTITWTSVFPGANGDYDSYLNCTTDCDTTTVTAQPGFPSFIDYMVCGKPIGGCGSSPTVCDTARAYFVTTLFADINPKNPTICFGGTNATITASGIGGAPPYSFLWSTGATTAAITVGVGTYYVTVSDTTGCPPATDSITVTAFSSAINANAGADKIICANNPAVSLTGSVTAASGGTWSNGNGTYSPSKDSLITTYTPTAGEIAGGSMQLFLTTTGNGSCPADTDTIAISFDNFSAVTLAQTNVSCNGGNNGSITATPSNGVSAYSYQWNDGNSQITQTATGLIAGTYSVTVTDANSCVVIASATITQPLLLAATATATAATCNGTCNGTLTASASGGTTNYSFSWSGGLGSGASKTNVCAGTYTVTVTDSKGCTATASATVNQPAVLTATATATAALCNGNCNGTLSASASGGTTNYSFLWSGGLGSGASKSNVCAGTYTVTATDANGCTATSSATVSQPNVLVPVAAGTNATCNATCNGTVSAGATGGTTNYSFSWSGGLGAGASKTNVCAGTYTVTVTDANGCTATTLATVSQPAVLTATATATAALCNGSCNGTLSASATGGTTNYSFSWSGGLGTGANKTNVCASTYTVTATDANGCTATSSATVTQPAVLTATAAATAALCKDSCNGTLSASATGGTTNYSFSWSGGLGAGASKANVCASTYTVTATDANGCTATSSATVNQPAVLTATATATAALCKDSCNGTLSTSAIGGTTNYSFSWSGGLGTGASKTNVCAGTYTVTATDANGCTATSNATVNQPAVLTATATATTALCKDSCNGTLSASATGGTTNYSFSWSGGLGSGASKTNVCASTYTVTATDANGCTSTSSATVNQPTVLTATATATAALCKDSCNGTLSASATGGTTNYSFSWSGGLGSGTNKTNVCAGTYTVTATDANGCTTTSNATVNQPAVLTATATAAAALCKDSCNGTLSASATGGTTSYSFSWSGGLGSGANKTNVCAGTYTVTATDTNGCTATSNATVNQPAVLTATATATAALCKDSCNGTLNASAIGGTTSYSFSWSSGLGNGANKSNVCAGTYSVTATDANGCKSFSSATVSQPAILVVTIDSSVNVSCKGGNDGFASDIFTGGTSPYSLQWSNGNFGSSTQNLSIGTYILSLTDANGCLATDTVTITEPDSALAAATTSDSVSCKGGNDGSVAVAATGGTSPYTYQWTTSDTTSSVFGLPSSVYSVTVTDTNNCTLTASVNVGEPATLLSLDTSSTMVICNGGSNGTATVTASGGVFPYSYQWDANANSQVTSTATGLAAGTYSVTVTDNNNCVKDTIVIVNQPFSPLSIIISTDSVNCFGGNDGSANVTPSGGTSPYTYQWNDINLQTDSTATGLIAGTYSVTVTDNTANCKVGNAVIVSQPDSLALNPSSTNVSCFGGNNGSASVAVTGGISPYNYLWNNSVQTQNIASLQAGNYSVTVTDNNNCADSATFIITEPAAPLSFSAVSSVNVLCNGDSTGAASVTVSGGTTPYFYMWNNGVQTQNIASLPAGNYFVTVTDTNNCTIDTSVTITQPFPALAVTITETDVSCYNGSNGTATVTPSGGTPPYSYLWSDANSQTDSTATGLISGTYSVTVTDNNGCPLDTNSAVVVGQPATYVTVNITANNVSCNGGNDGSATTTASGGTSPYTYQWSNGTSGPLDSNLTAGNYIVTVVDNNNCANDTNNITITEPQLLLVNLSSTDVICKGDSNGTATITPSGGTSPYSYLWDANANSQTDSIATGLKAGTYSATVTDANGCTNGNAFFTINEPAFALSISTSFTNVVCFGDSNGTATVTPSGGISPYFYQWDANANSQIDSTASGLKQGAYSVTVTDNSGCIDSSLTINISEPQQVIASASVDDTICPNATANISVNASGGTGSYSYTWNQGLGNGQNQTVNPASNTIYIVTVTDNSGCVSIPDSVEIFVRNLYFDSLKTFCGATGCIICPGASTNISATYVEEFPPYSYIWSNSLGSGLGPFTVTPPATTTYTITVTDMCGNQISNSVTVNIDQFPVISLLPVFAEGCKPLSVTFQNSVQNPAGSTYSWKFGDGATSTDSMPYHTYSDEGTYNISLTIISPPPANCPLTKDTATTVIVHPLPLPVCSATPTVADLKSPEIKFTTGSFTTYYWDFGDKDSSGIQNPMHIYSDSGDFTVTVTVTNQYGCPNTCEVTVRINPVYPLGIPNAFTPDPNGPNGGTYSFDDFTNNVFFPITRYVTDFQMEIFNRWGELLFVSKDINKGWDGYYRGELCQQDVYVWKIHLKWWDSNEFNGVGDVTLVR